MKNSTKKEWNWELNTMFYLQSKEYTSDARDAPQAGGERIQPIH
jgi:hypothetical protein